ncbi:cation-translocating P-type ATPase [Methyloversatilis sp. XJ19-13]|uniref:cation-translocating P-type ATPase n=1 Tax=Methyloversatilis sp. XJ19-13 TaxID=2963430 RepID=UPI00211C95BC|nr:cation-translocating P-type ATPase [Methyloversatilis sp. XJ19-13]MCQ9375620.1 cation-translocating P-type ATPase [Methyloversatilis sp. XJ19-13]
MSETSAPSGLSEAEVAVRRARDGWNELAVDRTRSIADIVLEVAREPMFLLMLGAGALYLLIGDAQEALVLLGFVLVIIAVTVVQQRRTETALAALRDLSSPRALVLRDGKVTRVAGRDVVVGDRMLLNEGDRVPADGLVLSAHDFTLDESMLTGESVAVARLPVAGGPALPVFAGTLVVSGQATVEVSAIGNATELGRIGKSLGAISSGASPLQIELAKLARRLAVIGGVLCVLLALLYAVLRGGWLDGLLAGITLAMGVLPQEFPVILIVFLAFGARRIAVHGVLTRRLAAIETLGQTTVLCVDKTGTLTRNRMAVAALVAGDDTLHLNAGQPLAELPETFHRLLEYAVLASEADPHDPMEKAFLSLADAHLSNTEHLHPDWRLAREYELSPDLLAMSHLWQVPGSPRSEVASKGAPEAIADLCHLSPEARAHVAQQAGALADRGLRVLAVAHALHPGSEAPAIQHDFEFRFIGLIGLADPLRDGVPAAVAECRAAGVRVVMITGDHPRTARAIAAQAGIEGTRVLTGPELAAMDDAAFAAAAAQGGVFARVSPQQKLALVEALKARGDIVAMTGDGVNDAPALKAAHIGIAMGRRGTDVAREAADLVLVEDDFAALVHAIRLGRRIFRNLRHAMTYTLAVHVPIIALATAPVLFGWPLVLAPAHIAFLELVIDPSCSVVFESDEADAGVMHEPPRPGSDPLLPSSRIWTSLLLGTVTSAVVLAVHAFASAQGFDASVVRTWVFITLVSSGIALIFCARTHGGAWLNALRGTAPVARAIIAATLLALLAVTSVPWLAMQFGFTPLAPAHWLAACALGLASFVPLQVVKRVMPGEKKPGAEAGS